MNNPSIFIYKPGGDTGLLITSGEMSPLYSDSERERRRVSSLTVGVRDDRDSRIENRRLTGVANVPEIRVKIPNMAKDFCLGS